MSYGKDVGDNEEFPFPEKLALLQKGRNRMPAKNPWHYKERIDDAPVFGVQPPLWVVAFCDNPPGRDPGPGEPEKAFDIEEGKLVPGGQEPANDEYVIVKDYGGGQVALVMAAERSGYSNGIEFDGETVIPNTDEVDPGYMVNLGLQ